MTEDREPMFSRFRLNSLAIAVLGVICMMMALQLPLGTPQAPGAGMWPLLISAFLILTSLLILFTERDGSDYEPLTKRSFISLAGFVWIAVFVLMFSRLGFTTASLVFSVVWLRFLARESWRLTLIASLLFTVSFVLIFSVLLRVPVPHDPVLAVLTGGRF